MADEATIRTRGILKDIAGRFLSTPEGRAVGEVLGITTDNIGTLDAEQLKGFADYLEASADANNAGRSAWSNPDERHDARAAYALKGKSDIEKRSRWDKGAYLMDPDTYRYMQGAGRDVDFLRAMAAAQSLGEHEAMAAPGAAMTAAGPMPIPTRSGAIRDALAFWDKSNFNPLARESWAEPNYQSHSGIGSVLNATQNPDVTLGKWLNFSEQVPDRIRLGGSGEADTGEEAWEGARAKKLALERYMLDLPVRMLDVPAGSDASVKAKRLKELQTLTQSAAVPQADQRWARWTKQAFGKSFVPPGWITDTGDALLSFADPTALLPVGGFAAGALKVLGKGAQIAGSGWVRPLLANLAKSHGKNIGFDMASEQGLGHGISAFVGGKPGRTPEQFAFGSASPEQKSDDEVAASRMARQQLHDQLKDDDGVSRAHRRAYEKVFPGGPHTPLID